MTVWTGARWQHHQVITIGSACADGSRYPYVMKGAQNPSWNDGLHGSLPPMSPQEQLSRPGSPGYGMANWDWRNSFMWAVKQVGYQVNMAGKMTNSWPMLFGDKYVFNVNDVPIVDRYIFFLDDSPLGDMRASYGGNAYIAGQPYSEVDHSKHNDALYYATASKPFNFNNQGTLDLNVAPTADTWNTSDYLGTDGYAARQVGPDSALLPDYYNRMIMRFLQATPSTPDRGLWPKPPFVLYLAPRGSHQQWVVAQRHWNVVPQNISSLHIADIPVALAPGVTTLAWGANEPDLSGRSRANGAYVLIGNEPMRISNASIGTGTWTLTRDCFGDAGTCMPQVTGMPTWPIGTPVIQLSSSLDPDVGDFESFNEADMSDKAPWYRAEFPRMDRDGCVKARRDRIIKAKCGMAHDELAYDIRRYCDENFTNPTVTILITDNGWTYGEHCNPKGKLKPYDLPGVGPLFCKWPDGYPPSDHYPYFDQRPNIIFYLADDDDTKSLTSGYPILAEEFVDAREENGCVASNLDMAATICDLAGAPMHWKTDGHSLAPYLSGTRTGGSPRMAAPFNAIPDESNPLPRFSGIFSINQRYWHYEDYTMAPTPAPGTTPPLAPGTYAGILEGYDHRNDRDECNNAIANPIENPGYDPAAVTTPFTPEQLAELEAMYQASRIADPEWISGGGEPVPPAWSLTPNSAPEPGNNVPFTIKGSGFFTGNGVTIRTKAETDSNGYGTAAEPGTTVVVDAETITFNSNAFGYMGIAGNPHEVVVRESTSGGAPIIGTVGLTIT